MFVAPNTPHMRQFLANLQIALANNVKETRRSEIKRIVEEFIKDPQTTKEEGEYLAKSWGLTMTTFLKMIQRGDI